MKTPTKESLLELLNAHLKTPVTVDTFGAELEALGLDSMGFIRVIVTLEETFGCEVPDSRLIFAELNTAEKLYDLLVSLFEETP